jgi:hypothetical protein
MDKILYAKYSDLNTILFDFWIFLTPTTSVTRTENLKMSAYALPGSVFPPIGGSCSSKDMNSRNCRSLHHYRECKEKKGSVGHFSLEPVDTARAEESLKEEDYKEDLFPREVGIAVKKATIDPVRLIRAVTAGCKTCVDSRSCAITQDLNEKKPTECCRKVHEDAIQFELSISFNGRSYCAIRTLPRIMELRNDLVREINSRRKRFQTQRLLWNSKTKDSNGESLDVLRNEEEKSCSVRIPDIPECDTNSVAVNGGGGVAGRGFAMLQALLVPYCPAIERWLQMVVDLIPPNSSPSLSHFLWEPVSADIGSRTGMMRSSSSLECIAEDVDSEEDAEQ